MRILLYELGVPHTAMLLEEKKPYHERNVCYTADLLQQKGREYVILVTSALHMRRAVVHYMLPAFL